jgi:hypothetical protein
MWDLPRFRVWIDFYYRKKVVEPADDENEIKEKAQASFRAIAVHKQTNKWTNITGLPIFITPSMKKSCEERKIPVKPETDWVNALYIQWNTSNADYLLAKARKETSIQFSDRNWLDTKLDKMLEDRLYSYTWLTGSTMPADLKEDAIHVIWDDNYTHKLNF